MSDWYIELSTQVSNRHLKLNMSKPELLKTKNKKHFRLKKFRTHTKGQMVP